LSGSLWPIGDSGIGIDTCTGMEVLMSVPATKRRILVVDDNLDAAVSLSRLIALLGHDVNVARDGSSALFIARRTRPDFVLLDIGLPGTDGFQVAAALRREPGLAALKIIAVTGRGEQEDRERSEEAGIDYYLLKPVDVPFLESLLGNAIPSG
jgi:two-component system, sensor histidine kinase